MSRYRWVVYDEKTDRPAERCSYKSEAQAEKHCKQGQYVVCMKIVDSCGPFGDRLIPVGE